MGDHFVDFGARVDGDVAAHGGDDVGAERGRERVVEFEKIGADAFEVFVEHHGSVEAAKGLERLDVARDFRGLGIAVVAVEVDAVGICAEVARETVGVEDREDGRIEVRRRNRAGGAFRAGRAGRRFRRRGCRRKDRWQARRGRSGRARWSQGRGPLAAGERWRRVHPSAKAAASRSRAKARGSKGSFIAYNLAHIAALSSREVGWEGKARRNGELPDSCWRAQLSPMVKYRTARRRLGRSV